MKTKNTLIQVFFIHSRFNNIIRGQKGKKKAWFNVMIMKHKNEQNNVIKY
jgi:hypothetical protein